MSKHLLGLIEDAVSETVDGREFGVVVSGGVDSSSIACVADWLGYRFPTFTGFYTAAGFDERQYARLVARRHRGAHHEILIGPDDFVRNFDAMAAHLKHPVQGMGTFGQYMVAKYIAEVSHVQLVLSGEGGDELFGGYARLLKVAGEPLPAGYEDYRQPDGYPDTLEAALAWDWERLPDLLAVDDQMMAAHGLQAVAPFTHPAVVEWVLAQPPERRVGKRLLKETVRHLVPEQILARTDKMGFPIPLAAWAQQEPVRSFVHDRLGYTPDPETPWDRGWWLELCHQAMGQRAEVAA